MVFLLFSFVLILHFISLFNFSFFHFLLYSFLYSPLFLLLLSKTIIYRFLNFPPFSISQAASEGRHHKNWITTSIRRRTRRRGNERWRKKKKIAKTSGVCVCVCICVMCDVWCVLWWYDDVVIWKTFFLIHIFHSFYFSSQMAKEVAPRMVIF